MVAIKKILVPVDFSESSRSALRYAMGLGTAMDANITVLHMNWIPAAYVGTEVMMTPVAAQGQTLQEYTQTRAEESLEQMVREVCREQAGRVKREVGVGDAARGIIERARDGKFDLVVMGTHGRSGLDHWLIGSVAEKVVRGAPCPVLTVRYQPKEDV